MKVDIYSTNKKYNIIYADPPWEYKQKQINFQHYNEGKKYINSVNEHYNTMSKKELFDMKDVINDISNNESCLLFMWATCPNLDLAIDLGKNGILNLKLLHLFGINKEQIMAFIH